MHVRIDHTAIYLGIKKSTIVGIIHHLNNITLANPNMVVALTFCPNKHFYYANSLFKHH